MAVLSSKLRSVKTGFVHWCPGCEETHILPHPRGWTFNGDPVSPTFSPSFRHDWKWQGEPRLCHYFIRDGHIEFCGDSLHPLAGQTVELPDIPTTETLGTAGAE